MSKTAVYNQTGEKISDLDLNSKIFGLAEIDANLVHQAMRTQQNNKRGPWAHTKMMGEVSGSGKKPWKQKGTGRARVGSVRSPLWRHGGITFGPRKTRDYSLKMNRTAWRKSLFTVLTDKVMSGKLIVIDNLDNTNKTKILSGKLLAIAGKAGLGKKILLIMPTHNSEVEHAAQNLPFVKVLAGKNLNILDLLKHDVIIMKDALPIIEQTYLSAAKAGLE